MTDAQYQKTYGQPRRTAETVRREQESEERRRAAQRQKSGLNDRPTAAQREATNRALRKTPSLMKESAKGAVYGHLTTLNDIASIKSQGKGKSREEIYDPNLAEKSRQQAEKRVKKLQAKTQETEDAIQKLTKNAKGLEKAYYGAVESGTGMLTDVGIGALTGTGQVGSLAAMYSRTYGSTRGKAQKEGATQAEDRAYAAAQAAKEVGTELMFPGAGLARGYAGKQGLKLADTAANILTKNLRGKAADLGGAGVRLIGGVLEENAEELAGWGLDPLIKEITYGKNARTRNAQQAMKERSNALRAEIQNEDDARAAAAYLSSDDFFEQTVNAYREAGLSKKDAEEVADRMRDYLTASLTGDTDSMEQIEDEVSKKVAGSKKLEWDFDELKDTIASTTLLTAATGLPGTGMTAVKGAALREQLGDDGVRALANTAIDFEDSEMSLKAKAMKARLDSGNELTSTQVYDLQVGMQEQIRKDTQREESSRRMADKRIKSDNLLTPYRQNENGGIDLDEATEASYREHVSKAKDIIDGLTSETKESLTANEKVDGSKAIAGFQTGVFTIEDANTLNYSNTTVRAAFEEATGVDLGQYVVKNKDGSVNIPATNTTTKDALFAMAADNLVKSAQASTADWIDNTKGQVVTQVSARMGAQGSAALQQALDDVDERDRSKYMMTTNAADMMYQAARNMGAEWSDISAEATRMFPDIDPKKLEKMYIAGLEDRRIANSDAHGRQVKMGQALSEMGEKETATGKVFIDTEVPLKGSVIRTFTEIAKNLGADIHFVDYIYDSENNPIAGANGSYDANTNTFYLNVATGAETNIGYIFMHETTHYLKTYAPEQYQALENLVRERWFAFNPSQMQDAIARKIEAYKRATKGQQVLTEEQALEEIIADASHDFINDPEFARQVAEEDMGLAKAVLDSIRNALRMLRRIFASGSIDDDTHMNSLFRELDIMAEAEKLWLDAYKVAVRNSSIAAMNAWQDEANEQSRMSVAEDKWNNDEKLTKAKFNSFYSAHKLTYGRATKENIDDVVAKIKTDGFISTTAIANVVPASINDYVDPEKPNLTQSKYGAKEGDVVMLVPNKYVDLKNDIIKNGYKPRDYEIVTVERDYQPYYELYSKAYDDAHQTRYSVSDNHISSYSTAAYSGQVNMRSDYKMGDNVLGYVDWTIYNDKPSISYIEVDKDYRRQGIARKLLQDIQRQYPDTEIDFGMTTEDGTALVDSITYDVEDEDTKNKLEVLESKRAEIADLEKKLNSDEITDEEAQSYGDQWDKLNDEIRTLESETEGQKPVQKFVRFSINETDNEGKSLSEDQRTFFRYVAPELKDENGNLKRFYHGTGRADRVGYYFDPERATSGPMAYFTDNKDIATNYSQSKQDTSLAYESDDIHNYHNQFVVDVDGEEIRLEDYWHMLPASKRNEFKERAGHITRDWDTYELTYDENVTNGNGGYGNDPYLVRKARGNAFTMLIDAWLDSGDFFGEEEKFLEVMDLLGMEGVKYKDPDYREEKVYEVYLNVTNPLVTSYIDDEFVADVKDWVDATDLDFYAKESAQADMWDKNSVDPYDWIERLESDVENDTTHAWTSIPDVITDFLKEQGYDGIVDKGGKGGGIGHQVVIPFSSEQIKDINNEHPTKENPDIRYSITPEMDEQYMDAVNSGNMEEAQRLVEEAAKAAGYTTPKLYHGTPSFGFTTFDLDRGENIIFATSNPLTAETYSGETDRRNISDAPSINVDELYGESLLAEAAKHRGKYKFYQLMSPAEQEKRLHESRLDVKMFASAASTFIDEHRDAFDEEKLAIANRIVDSIDRISNAWADDMVDSAWNDFEDAVWDLKWMDESIQMELTQELQNYGSLLFAKNRVSDFMYAGDIYRNKDYEADYVFDNQLALELDADLHKGIYELFGRGDNQLVIDANGSNWNQIVPPDELGLYGIQRTRSIAEAAKNKGYDSVLFRNLKDNGGETPYNGLSDVYMFFNPNQVKSADPVTYAEDGSVIPLSERFDPTNNDIRYSLPTQDSDGNILTDGQMEYFKNSQARDSQGRLVPVYHTTNKGGFTIFDPTYSDDRRSLFFSDDWDVSQTYGNYANSRFYYFDIDNIDDVAKYLEAYSPDRYFVTQEQFDQAGGWEADMLDFENVTNGEQSDFAKYLDNPDGYIAIIGVPDYSPDNTSYADTWVMAKSPDELVRELHNHFGWQRDNYRMGTQHGYYACYLNLEDPMIIDAKGQYWDSIKEDGFEQISVLKIGDSYDIVANGYPISLSDARKIYGDDMVNQIEEFDGWESGEYHDFYTWEGAAFDPEEEGHWPMEGNTRFWANEAEAMGCDGLIIYNLIDIGGKSEFEGSNEMSTIYIAFSSNQVKDVNNENPSDNPDIRYSITDDDEAMSHAAHDYAYDNSEEALAYYESIIDNDTSEETTYERAKKYIAKDVDEFYAGLTHYADGMKFDDPVLEQGRVRMARSKQDYFNSNIAKWNESWLTEGEVLDPKSVKKPVRDLVAAVMQESDTTRKYKTELVNKAIIDMRLAYFYAKQGRTDVADALLWHSAHRMIDGVEFYADDSTYEDYKGLRDYLKTTRIQLGEEYWSDADYGAFRKANFGRINLVKGSTNVDQVYAELEEMFPGLFDSEEYTTPPDQLMDIAAVLDSIQPYKEAYSSEQAAEFATDIASDLLDIMQNGKELQSMADKYKNRYEAKVKAMKARHAEAMLKVRQEKEKGIKAEKAKFKEYVEKQREKKYHAKYFNSIQTSYKKLTERLLSNTADKNIPEQYKKELAKVLAAFDLQTVGSKKWEARNGRKSQKSIKMASLKVTLGNIENKSGEFHVSDAITDIIDELLGKNVGNGSNRSIEGLTLDELNSSELARIDKLLKALVHEFNTYKTVKINTKRQQVQDIGKAQVESALEHAKVFGAGQDYYGFHGWVDRILNMDELTPAYLFRRIDPNKEGMALMYEQLEDSHDKYIRNTVQLSKWIDEIVGEYHHKGLLKKDAGVLEEWRSENYAEVFKLENGHTIVLTPAQIMSVYCLSKRAQAYNHMTGAGIVVAPVSYNAKILSDLKKKAKVALPEMLTDADIKNIVSKLNPDQVKVADKLQNLMADKMAAWGNEASMNVLGIELFGEPDYFPIKSDKAGLISDLSEDQFVEAIRSFGFTKAVQPGARNAIMVEDIFDVITQHCNNMNLYNAYSEAINDFMKVYNYRNVSEEGEYTVKQAIGHAYSQKATNFIMSFMKDLNGNVSNGRTTGINDAFNDSLAKAKKASVFANIRVAAQQPTAIGRAFAVISPKYASAMLKPDRAILDEMFEHCPIAKWKSLGYYDINMGRNIEDVIMNNNNVLEEAATWAYGALDNLTWGGIWQMVKAETEDIHSDIEKGSDEYWDLCNRRMREVVAFTQVVDSPFHRSHAMRSKNFMDKLATAFGAEPTLTYNMVRDGYIRAKEMVLTGDKAGATKVFGRTMSVFVFTAGLTAAAAAFADVLRGKHPDGDDDDELTLLQLWWANTLANWKDNVNLLNNIYYVKDIMSLLDGWQINNLAFQGWKYIGTGVQQLYGSPYARSKDPWWKNMMYGVGYLSGMPIKTVMTDFGAVFNKAKEKLGFETPILDAYLESLDEISFQKDDAKASSQASMWSVIKENTVDKAAEKMGYKPVEQNTEEGATERESFLARIGLGKTEEEKQQEEFDNKAKDIAEKTADLEGEAKDKKVWSYVTTYLKSQNGDKPISEFIQAGDYSTIDKYRGMYVAAGGNTDYFDQRIFDTSKSAMKKTIVYDPTDEQIAAQDNIKSYLLTHGMDESELSEMVYKSDTAKDMKVAFRLNDKELMLETLTPLVRAGLSYEDLERLWDNRNRMQLSSYKGRYKDKLKSTGKFIWPTDGQITSYFGYRNAPTAGASSNHPAIDIGAPMGADVVAADGGVVIYAGTNGGYGNSVGIKHDNGMITYYNHLSAWNVNVGDTVAQGQQIANVGSTGISTGPHLDFKILDADGEPVDPLKYLSSRS
jgi:murein DD-endopeptidase MepM/ murein hydrolase activator NlpD/ribosomal protein S18 acetylase RimI-like enzyme